MPNPNGLPETRIIVFLGQLECKFLMRCGRSEKSGQVMIFFNSGSCGFFSGILGPQMSFPFSYENI